MSSPSPSSSPISPSPSPSPDSPSVLGDNFTSVYVKAWGSFVLPITLKANESVYWEYKTQAHDIQFSVQFVPAAGSASPSPPPSASSSSSFCKKTIPSSSSAPASSTAASKPQIIVPLSRIDKADQILQHGSYQCTAPNGGTLTLTFDNTYSKLRGKNLQYRTVISSLETDRNAIPFGEVRLSQYGPAVIEGVRDSDGIYMCSLPYGQGYFNSATLLTAPVQQPPRSINQRCMIGVDLFFNNRVWDAENFFKKDIEKFPVFSLCYGSLGFLRALMTWDKTDIANANARLKQTRNFVSALLPAVSTMKSVGRFLSRSSGPSLTIAQLELTLLQAEAYLLQSMLLFTEETYMSYIKAGLKIRSAWKLYEKCDEQVRSYDDATRAALDNSVVGGIKYGIGSFNVIISTLPSIILRLVSALGFPSDRSHGLKLLEECAQTPGVRQGLASLMLLFVHIVIPSFFTVRPAYHLQNSKRILESCFQQYPHGALFLWMEGRANRMQRNLPAATESFIRAARGQPNWAQLQHLCAYELAWCYFFSLDFVKSLKEWERLERESSWSKAFFLYMQGVCYLALNFGSSTQEAQQAILGLSHEPTESQHHYQIRAKKKQVELASACFSQVESRISRKFGGKIISIEAFASMRSQLFLQQSHKKPTAIPELEMIYLFYGFIQMDDICLKKCLQRLTDIVAHQKSELSPDDFALCQLIHIAILKALHRWNDAKVLAQHLTEKLHEQDVEIEKYIYPFARFEWGALLMEQVVEKDAIIANGGNGTASIDQPLPTLKADEYTLIPASSSASVSSSAKDWSIERLAVLDQSYALIKKTEGHKIDYHFKNRLHLRLHLASVEVKMLRHHWREIEGNVQSEADIKGEFCEGHGSSQTSHGSESSTPVVMDSDEDEE